MSDSFYDSLQWLYWATLLATCGYAAVAGGRDHWHVASIHLATSSASAVATVLATPTAWLGWQPAILAIDVIALFGFGLIALRSFAFWPMWVTGFHLDAVLTHIVRGLVPASLPSGYSILQGFWAYPVMVALAIGTWRHQQDRNARLLPRA